MLFEEQPWLLVPIIIVTVEAWMHVKRLVSYMLRRGANWDTATDRPPER